MENAATWFLIKSIAYTVPHNVKIYSILKHPWEHFSENSMISLLYSHLKGNPSPCNLPFLHMPLQKVDIPTDILERCVKVYQRGNRRRPVFTFLDDNKDK